MGFPTELVNAHQLHFRHQNAPDAAWGGHPGSLLPESSMPMGAGAGIAAAIKMNENESGSSERPWRVEQHEA